MGYWDYEAKQARSYEALSSKLGKKKSAIENSLSTADIRMDAIVCAEIPASLYGEPADLYATKAGTWHTKAAEIVKSLHDCVSQIDDAIAAANEKAGYWRAQEAARDEERRSKK